MSLVKTTVSCLTLFFILSGPALAAELSSMEEWKIWLTDSKRILKLQEQVDQVQHQGTMGGHRKTAYLSDQIAYIHSQNYHRFRALTSSLDRVTANQAELQASLRRGSAKTYREVARLQRSYARQVFASNLGSTEEWKASLVDEAVIQSLNKQVCDGLLQSTSPSLREAAEHLDQIARIHARNVRRFGNLTNSPNETIARQARSRVKGHKFSAKSKRAEAKRFRRYASRL